MPIARVRRVKERYTWDSDVGMLAVRRPAGVRSIQLWRDELYSAPPKPDQTTWARCATTAFPWLM